MNQVAAYAQTSTATQFLFVNPSDTFTAILALIPATGVRAARDACPPSK